MRSEMMICFSVESVVVQDGNTAEYQIGSRSAFSLHADTTEPFQLSQQKRTSFEHIMDNLYRVRGYVYDTSCAYALLNLGMIKVSVCNDGDRYKEGAFVEGEIALSYDPWSCYGMNVCDEKNDNALYVEGITRQISLVTTPGHDNITLEHTSSWEDEENYVNATSSYLIDAVLCEDKVLEPDQPRLHIDKNRLVVSLDGLSSYKIEQIKAFIKNIK